jgi:hypothetical protein
LRLRHSLAAILWGPYRVLAASQVTAKLWRPDITKARFSVQGEATVKYLHQGRTVAQFWHSSRRFWCRKPYDLVIKNPSRRSDR